MKRKNFTLLLLAILFLGVQVSQAQNLLHDGDFSTTTTILPYVDGPGPPLEWRAYQKPGAEALATVQDGVCSYQVNLGGDEFHYVQLMQWGFPLILGNNYRLSFDVKGDGYRPFGLYLGEDDGNWTSILGYQHYYQYATPDWQTMTFNFNARQVFDYHKLSFEVGVVTSGIYFDNISLENLGPPVISITGPAANGWDSDVEMTTTDGIVYTLKDYWLNSGSLKFRQDYSWEYNWGGYQFPEDSAYWNGPNIMVTKGTYTITFDRFAGQYHFECTGECPDYAGITGTAVPPYYNWDKSIAMFRNSDYVFTLTNVTVTAGGAKFRINGDEKSDWGGSTFPTGTASVGGPEIPVIPGTYNVSFNSLTGDYAFTIPSVGMIGTALSGWDTDVVMKTSDGIIYSLWDYPFSEGEVKFRLDKSWDVNWGGWDFPTGYGWQNGPNLYVMAGTYDVTFNRMTGEYNFVATSCPLASIQCPYTVYAPSKAGLCGAEVWYPPVIPGPNCGGKGITIEQIAGLSSGSFFPVGTTTNTFILTNPAGDQATCSFEVYVYDAESPIIENLEASFVNHWPPNHKLVNLDYNVWDRCGQAYSSVYVWSSDTENDKGDGNSEPDWEILDDNSILFRPERSGNGEGRTYYINIWAWDDNYNYTWKEIIVTIPHDRRGWAFSQGNIQILNQNEPESSVKSAQIEPQPASDHLEAVIWPNPTDRHFNLQVNSSSGENMELSIFDVQGRLIMRPWTTQESKLKFGEDLKPGLYIAKIRQKDTIQTIKIIKQ